MIKTVSLTADAETKVEISGGYNVGVVNFTTDILYASRKSGISAGADDVAAIPAGDSYVIRAADDTVYLLATAAGDVQLESIGAKEVFKIAATRTSSGGGGGTVDEIARQAIASHANNEDIHLTAEDVSELVSNENLLINPDLVVNQRGQSTYTTEGGYTADGWYLKSAADSSGTYNADTRTLTASGTYTGLAQPIERDISGATITISAEAISDAEWYVGAWIYDKTTGGIRSLGTASTADSYNSVTIAIPTLTDNESVHVTVQTRGATQLIYAKAEFGDIATKFIPPDPATELAKCQRYYQICTTGDIDPVDLRPSMATIKDIKERSDGNYEYIAEL